ncbi:MAG: cyclodeaminase/cyclohydrolase family protein [Candidatus Limnocylindrales bacterium]
MDQASKPVSFADLTVRQFIESLSSGEPVPGGGAASALAGALGASLVVMVANLSTGRARYAAYESTLARCGEVGRSLASEFLLLADGDAEAYAGYATALKMPRETEAQREARRVAIEGAAKAASDAPWECVRACGDLVNAAEALAGRSNVNAASDVLVAALLGEAAARGAAENVNINLPSTGDEQYNEAMSRQLDEALHDIAAVAARTRETVLSGRVSDPEDE